MTQHRRTRASTADVTITAITAITTLALVLGLSACASVPAEVRGEWVLVEARDVAGDLALETTGASATLSIDRARLDVMSICDTITADIESVDPWRLDDAVSTEQACADPTANDLNARFTAALVDADHARVEDGELVIVGEDSRLAFAPQ